jgi:hypothetical protein
MKQFIILTFAVMVFSVNAFAQEGCYSNWEVDVYGFSTILAIDAAPQKVSGKAGTLLDVWGYIDPGCEDLDAGVRSELRRAGGNVLSAGALTSNGYYIEGEHAWFNAVSEATYCVNSNHGFVYWWRTPYGWDSERYVILYTSVCHTFPPIICQTGNELPCITPTPTPIPNPPTVAITQRTDIIEKNDAKEIKVTVTNNASGTTKLNLRTTNGTGDAVFDTNNTAELIINGNVTDQAVKIKGTTESSSVDNITVEAKLNTNTAVADHDEFTVAVISSLEFADNNSPLDSNPGTDGVPNPDGSEGRRIFPDKTLPVDPIDRQSVKIRATVLPSALNATVYFATYDLDDPSISTIIDPLGTLGNDNNGGDVTTGTNAGILFGASCTVSTGRADCSSSGGVSEALLTVTMQPGDNFAVAASLTQDYRNGIVLNSTDGSKLMDAANNELPITRTTGNNVIGIRSNILTTWRKLHIEVDSMGNANSNFVIGTITDTKKIGSGNQTINLSVSNLEPNRFENGRLEIKRGGTVYKSLRVIDATFTVATPPVVITSSNTTSSVTVFNNTGTFSVTNGDQFTLYDDDDMDDDDGISLNGDTGDNVPAPRSDTIPDLLRENDTACTDAFNANNCNVFVNAYVRPVFDWVHEDFSEFNSNADDGLIASYRNIHFQNRATEASEVFWTVWLFGGYQFEEAIDADADENGGVLGKVDVLNGIGATIFTEVNRPHEYDILTTWRTNPVGKRFTVAHEIGHLFRGRHEDYDIPIIPDAGLMTQTHLRTSPLFSNTTINKIRGGEFTEGGVTRRITHP